jgi:hypothetical protein
VSRRPYRGFGRIAKCAFHDQFQLELEGELLLRTLALIVYYSLLAGRSLSKNRYVQYRSVRGSMPPPSSSARQHSSSSR